MISYIKAEGYKLAAQERKNALLQDAKRILNELNSVDALLTSYSEMQNETDPNVVQLRQIIKSTFKPKNTINILGEDVIIRNLFDVLLLPSELVIKIITRFLELVAIILAGT